MKGVNSVRDFIKLHDNDNVIIALKNLSAGLVIKTDHKEVTLQEDIKQGHKIAIVDIESGQNIIKYGFPIGHATADIKIGFHVHTHNIKTNLGEQLSLTR